MNESTVKMEVVRVALNQRNSNRVEAVVRIGANEGAVVIDKAMWRGKGERFKPDYEPILVTTKDLLKSLNISLKGEFGLLKTALKLIKTAEKEKAEEQRKAEEAYRNKMVEKNSAFADEIFADWDAEKNRITKTFRDVREGKDISITFRISTGFNGGWDVRVANKSYDPEIQVGYLRRQVYHYITDTDAYFKENYFKKELTSAKTIIKRMDEAKERFFSYCASHIKAKSGNQKPASDLSLALAQQGKLETRFTKNLSSWEAHKAGASEYASPEFKGQILDDGTITTTISIKGSIEEVMAILKLAKKI